MYKWMYNNVYMYIRLIQRLHTNMPAAQQNNATNTVTNNTANNNNSASNSKENTPNKPIQGGKVQHTPVLTSKTSPGQPKKVSTTITSSNEQADADLISRFQKLKNKV